VFIEIAVLFEDLEKRYIVHGDLKPVHIRFRKDRPVLVDFGAASRLQRMDGEAVCDNATPKYAAPEQLGRPPGQRLASDRFAIGQMLLEAFTGATAFQGEGGHMRFLEELPVNDSIPEPVFRVIEKCLRRDWRRRHSSASELRRDLQNAKAEMA